MPITTGLTVTRLSAEEERRHGYTHAITVPYSVLVTAGGSNTTATIALLDVFAGDVVGKCGYRINTTFDASDASINSLTVKVGDGNDDDRFMTTTGTQLAADGSFITSWAANGLTTAPFAYNTTDTVDAVFTVAGGGSPTMAELTSGSVTIFLQECPIPELV